MKKFIMCCPIQPEGKLHEGVYDVKGNKKIEYTEATRFPIIPVIASYCKDEEIKLIVICPDRDTTALHYNELLYELDAVKKKNNIKCDERDDIVKVPTPFEETINDQLQLFGNLIKYIEGGDDLFFCMTYGTKPTPIVEMMVANYAYRALPNVMIEAIVYGQYYGGNETTQSCIYDITALFFMDEVVNNIAKLGVENPMEAIRKIMNMEQDD